MTDEKLPSARRRVAGTHLRDAAAADLGGQVEAYHLAAAAAEGLVAIEQELGSIRIALFGIVDELRQLRESNGR